MINEITFDGETMRGAGTATVALATMTLATITVMVGAGVLVVAKLVKIVGANPT